MVEFRDAAIRERAHGQETGLVWRGDCSHDDLLQGMHGPCKWVYSETDVRCKARGQRERTCQSMPPAQLAWLTNVDRYMLVVEDFKLPSCSSMESQTVTTPLTHSVGPLAANAVEAVIYTGQAHGGPAPAVCMGDEAVPGPPLLPYPHVNSVRVRGRGRDPEAA